MRVTCAARFAALAASISAAPAAAGPDAQVPVGARAVAMAGAYSALADDGIGLEWNPAGLVYVGHPQLYGGSAELFGSDIRDNVAGAVLPLSRRQALAFQWYRSGLDQDPVRFAENRFDLGYAFQFGRFGAAGVTAKSLHRVTELGGVSVPAGEGAGFGWDFGVIATPWRGLRAGIVVQDAFDTAIEAPDGLSTEVFERRLRAGVAYAWRERVTAALDIDDRWHLGGEWRGPLGLALRAGVEDDWHGDESATVAAGFGLRTGPVRFDYAYVHHPVLPATHHFGVALALQVNPSQVRIDKVEVADIYASQFQRYARSPFGRVWLRNLQDRPLETRIRVQVRGLMDTPSEQVVLLRPRAVHEVPLTAVIPARVLESHGDTPVQVVIGATYESLRVPRTETAAARLVAYGRGAIDWAQGVEQAAAFVTAQDPRIVAWAHAAVREAGADAGSWGTRHVGRMAAIVEALGAAGLAYVPDPRNPYARMAEAPHAVDSVRYPYETLALLTGDCDDSTVLLAALLGAVGIETAFVDVPEHIFLLADTGLHARRRAALGLPDELVVVDRERVWIPIETTATANGFAVAWREGAARYRDYAARGHVGLWSVQEAQAAYPPAQPPVDRAPATRAADIAALQARLGASAAEVASWRESHWNAHYGDVASGGPVSAAARLELARVAVDAGQLQPAQAHLERALDAAPAAAHNGLAIVAQRRGDLVAARTHLGHALRADSTDAGLWWNLALVQRAAGDTAAAVRTAVEAVRRAGGPVATCRLLDLAPADTTALTQPPLAPAEAERLLERALRSVPQPPAAAADSTLPAPVAGSQAQERRVGGTRGGDAAPPLALYWREDA